MLHCCCNCYNCFCSYGVDISPIEAWLPCFHEEYWIKQGSSWMFAFIKLSQGALKGSCYLREWESGGMLCLANWGPHHRSGTGSCLLIATSQTYPCDHQSDLVNRVSASPGNGCGWTEDSYMSRVDSPWAWSGWKPQMRFIRAITAYKGIRAMMLIDLLLLDWFSISPQISEITQHNFT